MVAGAEEQSEEFHEDGHVVAWTDGACRNNQDSRLRRAGAGVYFAPHHHGNIAFALPGECQTNQRAELYAVVLLLQSEHRPLDVRTDSKWVYDGANSWNRWRRAGWSGDHADLWQRFSDLMDARVQPVRFNKVMGHAKQEHVRRGLVAQIDKDGNDGADAEAVRGAAAHQAPPFLSSAAAWRVSCCRAVHRMMLAILRARRAAEAVLDLVQHDGYDVGDRGSEADTDDLFGELVMQECFPSEADPG